MSSVAAMYGITPISDHVDGLKHEPWVGSHFYESPIRPYILGDSHYDSDEVFGKAITHSVILEHGIQEKTSLRFLTGCISLLSGLPASQVDREQFWHRVAFSNLSVSQAKWSREAAPWESYVEGGRLFAAVVRFVRPEFVITLGDRVWTGLEQAGTLTNPRQTGSFWQAEILGVPVFHSQHPSGGFSWRRWSARFGEFLQLRELGQDRVAAFVDQITLRPRSELLKAFASETK